ncbi:MAG TPA: vitamin B12-dependent ribonucleotide reductase [Armatimonadota bacterium]|jgi:ribonucleoside-diphosphate reductase alpha chain
MLDTHPGSDAGDGFTLGAPPARKSRAKKAVRRGITVRRFFTEPDVHPFDELEWEMRSAAITDESGKIIFEQKDVEMPVSWSQLATNVVVSKYFKGPIDTPQRERSLKQLIGRVTATLTAWGVKDNYFADQEDAEAFNAELSYLLVNQYAAFNSPVWFNVGVEANPQCSACFIQSVQDNMSSIMDLAKNEVMLFKYGSGTGSNLSNIRSSKEHLGGGGVASGPVSFMKGYDSFAGVIKSGGKTRRAAKMVILNADHPDIEEFINCKASEERKAWALIDAGYDGGFNVVGGAYDSIQFQNANNSVRATDDFMRAVDQDGDWTTRFVTTGEPYETKKAREYMRQIAEAAWVCGDPGMQFHTTINDWHTCPNTAPINASNPCSEYVFLDDSACNLASLNLMKFREEDGALDIDAFCHAVSIFVLAQEIIVGNAAYPTEAIEKNSHAYRPLGLGYANLGALLMARGVPYDSDEGRAICGAITALMTGQAYKTSAQIAAHTGPFAGFAANREPCLRVIKKHGAAVNTIDPKKCSEDLLEAAKEVWSDAYAVASEHGVRNAQVTVLAPTGTIAFFMDCDTTGIEPDIALVKYKKLVGGGLLKIVNQTVPEALTRLGYDADEVSGILDYIDQNDTIEGAPGLRDEHLPVFDCAFKPANGLRSIHYMGHVRMMAAAQPFISGAISKTVNMPHTATAEEIAHTYLEAWKLGLKAIAIYRDGCKRTQPLNTSRDAGSGAQTPANQVVMAPEARPQRRRLPDERNSVTHKFSVAGHEGYITVGLYEDGTPGEVFITISKEGSVVSGMMDAFATAISLNLQYGVPLGVLVKKYSHMRFEPSGFTQNKQIPIAKSIVDYIFRWMALKFMPDTEQPNLPLEMEPVKPVANGNGKSNGLTGLAMAALGANKSVTLASQEALVYQTQTDAPPCPECGTIMTRSGSCYRCINCGGTSGCS